MFKSILLVLCLLSTPLPSFSQEEILVSDGTLVYSFHGDPSQLKVDHWEILLYKRGAKKDDLYKWGTITKPTREEVQKELEASQRFEKRYEAFMGISWGDMTYFNPSIPIAVTAAIPSSRRTLANQLKEAYDSLAEVRDAFTQAQEMGSDEVPSQQKFLKGPDTLKEYLDNVKDGISRAQQLYNVLPISPNFFPQTVGRELKRWNDRHQ